MTCVTCETTPPPERESAAPVHDGHIGIRFGHYGLGWAVLFRGYDVTLQCVEAVAGEDGWVEMRIMTNDGGPVLHPAGPVTAIRCTACGRENPFDSPVTAIEMPDPTCPECGGQIEPVFEYPAHVFTVIRQGHVQVIRGTEVINGPTDPQVEVTAPGEISPAFLSANAD